MIVSTYATVSSDPLDKRCHLKQHHGAPISTFTEGVQLDRKSYLRKLDWYMRRKTHLTSAVLATCLIYLHKMVLFCPLFNSTHATHSHHQPSTLVILPVMSADLSRLLALFLFLFLGLGMCVESLSATCQQLSASTKIQQYQGIEIEYTQEQQNYW